MGEGQLCWGGDPWWLESVYSIQIAGMLDYEYWLKWWGYRCDQSLSYGKTSYLVTSP